MKAMVLRRPANVETGPLRLEELPVPEPGDDELLVRVLRCGVCRTDLHVVEGDLPPRLPSVVPGHEVVGTVARVGSGARRFAVGDRVGVPWLRRTCGECEYCLSGRENLCDAKEFTGYSAPGGYAEYVVADARYALSLPPGDPDQLAPFLCAGIIGYRALKLARPRPGGRIGFFGFGGSAHLALAVASAQGYETVAYSRSREHLALADRLGAAETRLTNEASPHAGPTLDGAVVFAPVGDVVVQALGEVRKGATVAIAAIHLTPIPSIDYDHLLFGERRVVSVEANTRADAKEFLALAASLHLTSTVSRRPLNGANQALQDLKAGRVVGALVLDCENA